MVLCFCKVLFDVIAYSMHTRIVTVVRVWRGEKEGRAM